MPAPESLGIRLKTPAARPVDWDALREKVDRLGAMGFQLERHGDGYRFAVRLSSGLVEGFGSTEADAVQDGFAHVPKSR